MNRIIFVLVLLVALSSCGSGTGNNSSKIGTESKAGVDTLLEVEGNSADATVDSAGLTVADTPSFFLESDTLRGGYRFGMNIDQWNTNLAIHVKNGAPVELKQNGKILEGFTAIPELGKSNDNQQYGISTEGIFDFGYLIGVKYVCHLPQYILYDWSQNIIKEKGLEYIAGEEIQPIDEKTKKVFGFNYKIGQEYRAMSTLNDYLSNQQEQSEWKTNFEKNKKNFVALYKAENNYSVIECEIVSSIGVTYDTRPNVYYDQISGEKNVCYTHKIRDFGNESIQYGDLIIKVYSQKQAKINPEDYYNFEQKEKLRKSKSNEEIINRVLNKS
jgi:hypothetical protein